MPKEGVRTRVAQEAPGWGQEMGLGDRDLLSY